MTRYIAGRVLAGLVTLVVFVTLLFFLIDLVIPGDFATQFTLGMTGEELGELRDQLGLDRPVLERYGEFMAGLVRGDLGDSFTGRTVADTLKAVLPWTMLIFVFAIGIAFPVGHWLGKIAGWRSGEKGASGLTIGSVGLYTIFPPLLVFLLVVAVSAVSNNEGMLFFREQVNESAGHDGTVWFMLWTIVGTALVLGAIGLVLLRGGRSLPLPIWAATLIAAPVIVWIVLGRWSEVSQIIVAISLPAVAVAILAVGEVVLVSKSTTAEAAHEDFVFTARAKGVPDRQVRDKHVGRFAMLPILSKLMVSVPYVLVGLMIVEIAFAWPKDGAFGIEVHGLSSTLFFSLEARDTAVVVGGLLAVGIVVFAVRLLLDVLHAVLDPRIRVGGSGS